MGRGIIQDVSARIIDDVLRRTSRRCWRAVAAAAEPERGAPRRRPRPRRRRPRRPTARPAQAEPAAAETPPREAPAAGDGDDALPVFDLVGPVIAGACATRGSSPGWSPCWPFCSFCA